MSIPSTFYTTFRCKTSGMAAATGLLMGYFAAAFVPPFFNVWVQYGPIPLGGIIAVLINQYLVHNYIHGKMRGAFEYIYRESLVNSKIDMEIRRGMLYKKEPLNLELISLSIYKEIMTRAMEYNDDQKFVAYLAAAHAANAGSEYNNEIAALKQAVVLRPTDLITNYRLARAYERIGSAKEAIKSYETSLDDTSIDSEELKQFLISQAERVKEKGPQQASPIPGLIYQMM